MQLRCGLNVLHDHSLGQACHVYIFSLIILLAYLLYARDILSLAHGRGAENILRARLLEQYHREEWLGKRENNSSSTRHGRSIDVHMRLPLLATP
jgi:hypothetical protein